METALAQGEPHAATKSIAIKFAGGNRGPETLQIGPGTTTQDVLGWLQLGNGFLLSKGSDHDVLGQDENVYGAVQDGDVLYASPVIDAGH